MNIADTPKKYKRDNHTAYSCQYHVVFCPKFRRPVLTDGVDSRLRELMLERASVHSAEIIEMEVMSDHVHILIDVSPKKCVSHVIKDMKGYSAHVLREEFPKLKTRLPSLWSRGNFISSTGQVGLETVKRYIEEQKLRERS